MVGQNLLASWLSLILKTESSPLDGVGLFSALHSYYLFERLTQLQLTLLPAWNEVFLAAVGKVWLDQNLLDSDLFFLDYQVYPWVSNHDL